MKINLKASLVIGAFMLAMSAGAIPVVVELQGANGYGIGYDLPNLNPANYTTANLQDMVNVYNGIATSPIGTESYYVVSGANSPATAPNPTGTLTSSIDGNNQSSESITLLSGYNYLIAHWDGANGANAIYYIPNSLWGQTVDLVNDLPGVSPVNGKPQNDLGLSGYWYSGAAPSVPDGGATVILLGAAITGLAMIRRQVK